MNKEKLMELISIAIDKGAYISVHMSQYDNHEQVSKDTAFDYINQFKESVGTGVIETMDSVDGVGSFVIRNEKFYVACSYHKYMEEDVDFGGLENNVI